MPRSTCCSTGSSAPAVGFGWPTRGDQVMWLESAGGGLRVASAGKWLAAMTSSEVAYVDPERRAFADLMWEHRFGDRHTSMTILACGADPADNRRRAQRRAAHRRGDALTRSPGATTTTRSATGTKTPAQAEHPI